MSVGPALSGWQAFYDLQQFVDSQRTVSSTLAGEEALFDLLENFNPIDGREVKRRFHSLRRNRQRKHTRRRVLLANAGSTPTEQIPLLDLRDDLRHCKSRMTGSEWSLMQDFAFADDYKTLAMQLRMSIGQLRTRVSRVRTKIKTAA